MTPACPTRRSSDLAAVLAVAERAEIVAADPDRGDHPAAEAREPGVAVVVGRAGLAGHVLAAEHPGGGAGAALDHVAHHRDQLVGHARVRSEEHTSELQSLMRISYAVFCVKKKQ